MCVCVRVCAYVGVQGRIKDFKKGVLLSILNKRLWLFSVSEAPKAPMGRGVGRAQGHPSYTTRGSEERREFSQQDRSKAPKAIEFLLKDR